MNVMRHNLTILSIAALSLFFSCNKMETIQNPDGSITVTASVSMAQTKALTPIGEKTFAINDQLAVIYKKDNGSTAVAISEKLTSSDIQRSGKYAKFRVTFTDPDKTQSVTYVYPANMAKNDGDINYDALYSGQDGTLSKIASSFDLCTKVVSWSGSSLPEGQTLVNQLTVAQFTFRDGAIDGDSGNITSSLTGLTVTNGSDEYSVTLSSNTTVWVAMKPITTGDIEFEATDGSNNYTKTVTGQTMSMGTLYSNITVSMNKVPSIPTGAIDGLFTINGNGDQVYFSQGNLQAVCASADADGSTQETWTWQFAEHQYDYIGGRSNGGSEVQTGNNHIDGNGSVSTAGTVDLFGWVGTSSYNNNYGIWNNTTANSYGNTKNESLKNDWGHNAITNGGNTADMWRTLTREEWGYMLSTRSGAIVNGTNNVRFAKATIRTDATGVKGLLLFPDGVTFDASEASWGVLNDGYENYTTTCTAAQWTALEVKGCVFLPAAGNRTGTTVSDAGSDGAYWTATGSDSMVSNNYPYSYRVYFASTSWSNPQYYSQQEKTYGHSVRLVRDVE